MKYNKKKLWLIVPLAIFLALLAVFIKDIITLFPLILNKSEQSASIAIEHLGARGIIVTGFIIAVQLLIVFVPCEFMEIMSGIAYGPVYGVLICWAGVFIGASIIFALVNVFNLKIEKFLANNKSYEIIQKLNNSSKSVGKLLLILLFLPAIPIGVICYFGSSTNISYWRYIIVTMIGTLPSIVLDTVLGYLFIATIGKYYIWILLGILVFTIIAMIIIKKITTNKINKQLYGTTKPTMEMVLKARKPHEPSVLFSLLLRFIGKIYYKRKYNIHIDNSEIKDLQAPYIVLSPHGCYADFVLSTMAIKPQKANIMCNVYYFYKPAVRYLLEKVQAIPKKLFATDIKAIKDCMQVVKNDGVVIMMPEARLSVDGSNQVMPSGLEKLLKKLEVPVVVLETKGAYLSMAKWMKKSRKGRIDVKAKLVWTKEEVIANSAPVLMQKIEKALEFNDFKWQSKEQIEFKGKNLLKGVDDVLYLCPKCKEEFTLSANKNDISCCNCGLQVHMDSYYNFTNPPIKSIKNIQDWYRYQVKNAQKLYEKGELKLSEQVIVKSYNEYGKGLEIVGEGECVIDGEYFTFEGVYKGEPRNIKIEIGSAQLPALPFGCGENWELYHDNIFYYFIPKNNPKQCVKWGIYTDVISLNKSKQKK